MDWTRSEDVNELDERSEEYSHSKAFIKRGMDGMYVNYLDWMEWMEWMFIT